MYYLGAMQWLIFKVAWLMELTLGTSGTESMCAAGTEGIMFYYRNGPFSNYKTAKRPETPSVTRRIVYIGQLIS